MWRKKSSKSHRIDCEKTNAVYNGHIAFDSLTLSSSSSFPYADLMTTFMHLVQSIKDDSVQWMDTIAFMHQTSLLNPLILPPFTFTFQLLLTTHDVGNLNHGGSREMGVDPSNIVIRESSSTALR